MFDILSSNTRRGLIVTLSILIGLEGGIVLTKAPVYKSPKIGVRVPESNFEFWLILGPLGTKCLFGIFHVFFYAF